MKFIVSESQMDLIKLEKKVDAMYRVIGIAYPELYEWDRTGVFEQIEVFSNKDKDTLLFYYDYDRKEFYVGMEFLDRLFEISGLKFLEYNLIDTNNDTREKFDVMIKLFAKKYYGWDVKKVYFHWY